MSARSNCPASASPPSQRQLVLSGQVIDYQLRRSSRRSIGLTVGASGLRVSAPRWVLVGDIDRLLLQKSAWILQKLAEQQLRQATAEACRPLWQPGAAVSWLGERLILQSAADWPVSLARMARAGQRSEGCLYLPVARDGPPDEWEKALQRWVRLNALPHFEQRCQHFAAQMGLKPSKVLLSQARTRWGSANSQGHLRLNVRLVHLAPDLLDYVVVHELAHLREMNHSPRFWAIVAEVLPDHLSLRRRLREIALTQIDSVSLADSPL